MAAHPGQGATASNQKQKGLLEEFDPYAVHPEHAKKTSSLDENTSVRDT